MTEPDQRLPPAILLMGPTASGKTDLAISLCKRFPFDIVSVDSALVYHGMDIVAAKPDAETLRRTPHRLIDIRDPEESYSAGEFVRDARAEIDDIAASGRVPLPTGCLRRSAGHQSASHRASNATVSGAATT